MGFRTPLKSGSIVKMPNRGQYVVCERIAEGGLSLVYTAKTRNNGYPVIIKEFFPSEHARRAEKTLRTADGAVLEQKGCVYPEDSRQTERFNQCRKAFDQEGQFGSAAHMTNFQVIAFSDCGDGYAILPRWSSDTCSFDELVSSWSSIPPEIIDPVFSDLGRIRFALTAISSLLTVLNSLHEQNMLHLDISPSNVVWAGPSRISPQNGAAFLTDFGCSVMMADGAYPAEYALSYSKAFAAPEYTIKGGILDYTTDIYSVGMMLCFLCRGSRAFSLHTNLTSEINRIDIPKRHQKLLLSIIQKATAHEMSSRYQSAAEMKQAVNELLEAIPLHAINEDNSTAFTLYSLKSMLEGCRDTRYSWAHEMCDRRGVTIPISEIAYVPVANIPGGRFSDDEDFLKRILPDEIFCYFQEAIADKPNKKKAIADIMGGNYSSDCKRKISTKIMNYGLHGLFAKCRTLLFSNQSFRYNIDLLFQIPGDDIEYFERCYTECSCKELYTGLALLVLFALLGQGEQGFMEFANHSPSDISKMIHE